MPAPFSASGKQVLHTVDGLRAHFADAVSIAAAEQIVAALNGDAPLPPQHIDCSRRAHQVRQEKYEYACACGARWDVDEGEDHP